MLKNHLILFVLFFAVVNCNGDGNSNRYIVSVNNKYGFINQKGQIIVQPKYSEVKDFSEGLAAIKDGDLWGYINTEGKVIINPVYLGAFSFFNKRAIVTRKVNDNSYSNGFIDESGNLIASDYKYLFNFHEGLAAVYHDGKWGFIDTHGKIIIGFLYGALPFSEFGGPDQPLIKPVYFKEGRVFLKLNGKTVLLDTRGNILAEYSFDDVGYFNDGLAVVKKKNKFGLVNLSGKIILNPEYDFIDTVTGSLTAVYKNNKSGFINDQGKIVIPLIFDGAASFKAGLGLIALKGENGRFKFGYIDSTGKTVIKPVFDDAYTFDSTGYAVVGVGEKYGLIDQKGDYSIPLAADIKYDTLEDDNLTENVLHYRDFIKEGFVIYYNTLTNKKGFMTVAGRKITEPIFDSAEPFQNGIAKVTIGNNYETAKTGYIDTKGKYIWEPTR